MPKNSKFIWTFMVHFRNRLMEETLLSTMTTLTHRFVRTETLKNKSSAYQMCSDYIAWLERNTRAPVKRVHCDNSKKFRLMKPK